MWRFVEVFYTSKRPILHSFLLSAGMGSYRFDLRWRAAFAEYTPVGLIVTRSPSTPPNGRTLSYSRPDIIPALSNPGRTNGKSKRDGPAGLT